MKDIRFTQLCVRTQVSDGVISLTDVWEDPIKGDKWVDALVKQHLDTKEHSIRAALVKLGWTPPVKKKKNVVAYVSCPDCHKPTRPMDMGKFGVCELCEARGDNS